MTALAALLALVAAAPDALDAIGRVADALHRRGELTDEEFAVVFDAIDQRMSAPHWRPDGKTPPPAATE